MKILVLDNYDSFTYNLIHLIKSIGYKDIDVFRNDKIDIKKIALYDKILLSPGPGIPSEAGILLEVIKNYAPTKSILGVCLGHQAIAEAFGSKLINLKNVYHGLSTNFKILNSDIYLLKNIPLEFKIGRYHSWIVDKNSLPETLIITGIDDDKHIMSLSHKTLDVHGVQFHPESILTEHGEQIMKNWLQH